MEITKELKMETYRITYFMYPEKDIEFNISAKSYEDAVIFAKNYRRDSFNVVKVENMGVKELNQMVKGMANHGSYTIRIRGSHDSIVRNVYEDENGRYWVKANGELWEVRRVSDCYVTV